MTNTEQLQMTANQAAAKIQQLVENCTNVATNRSLELTSTDMQKALDVGYSPYDDESYKVNYPVNYPKITTIGGGHSSSNDNWVVEPSISIGNDWSDQLAKLTTNQAKQKEDSMLKQMPMELTIERMKKCAGCTYTNAVHCMHRFQNGEADTPCPCNQRDMLVYGHCPKFKSAEQVEIELAAEGVDDGKD